jgi:hypothetical protein
MFRSSRQKGEKTGNGIFKRRKRKPAGPENAITPATELSTDWKPSELPANSPPVELQGSEPLVDSKDSSGLSGPVDRRSGGTPDNLYDDRIQTEHPEQQTIMSAVSAESRYSRDEPSRTSPFSWSQSPNLPRSPKTSAMPLSQLNDSRFRTLWL